MTQHRHKTFRSFLFASVFALAAPGAAFAASGQAAGPPAGTQYTLSVLHTFEGSPDGTNPSPLIRDSSGTMYGTAEAGGTDNSNCEFGCGMVYKIDTAGNMTPVYDFAGGTNGGYPLAALAEDASGNLYGTTQGLGDNNLSVVFKLTPAGQETSYVPPSQLGIGSLNSPVVLDAQGDLYGMAPYGGSPNCGWDRNELGCGTLFEMTPDGTFSVVHTFTGTDGMYPQGGLVRDSKGNFYGVTFFGGIRSCKNPGNGHEDPGCGTIFKVDTKGNYTVLHTFKGKKDGTGPSGLIIDSEDNLYGIAQYGGDYAGNGLLYGLGTIFKLDTKTNAFSTLFIFTPNITESPSYADLLVKDPHGNLYGEKLFDCANNTGCVFRIDTKGKYTDLADFDVQIDGKNNSGFFPNGLISGAAGDFYGSTQVGGDAGFGTLFQITP